MQAFICQKTGRLPQHEFMHAKAVNVDLTATASILNSQETETLLRDCFLVAQHDLARNGGERKEYTARERAKRRARSQFGQEAHGTRRGWKRDPRRTEDAHRGTGGATRDTRPRFRGGDVLHCASATGSRGRETMAGAGWAYAQKVERQGRAQHRLAHPHHGNVGRKWPAEPSEKERNCNTQNK